MPVERSDAEHREHRCPRIEDVPRIRQSTAGPPSVPGANRSSEASPGLMAMKEGGSPNSAAPLLAPGPR